MKLMQRLLAVMSVSLWMFVSLVQAETVLDFSHGSALADMGVWNYPLTNLTLEAWIQTSTVPGANSFGSIAGRSYLGGGATGFGLFIHNNGNLSFQTRKIHDSSVTASYAYPFGSAWHHVAGVRDGDDTILYLDGVEVARNTEAISGSLSNSSDRFGLGQRHAGGWGFAFNGRIAEVRVWDHARSEQEIADNRMRRQKGNEAGLIGYWPLNEGEDSTVFDLSSEENNGTLTNTQWTTDAGLSLIGPLVGTTFIFR